MLPSTDAGHERLSLGSTSEEHHYMNQSDPASKLELVAETEPRLAHLHHPGFKLSGPAYNYASALAPILTHTPDVVHIYNFDGELDEQLRLEHLLLVWTGTTPLIIIASERNGGGETLDETKAIVNKLVKRPDWLHRIHTIAGTCLKSDTPACVQRTRRCVESLAEIVKRRSFVWHNNTTITLLAALIAFPLAYQMRAVTSTCNVMFFAAGLGSAFNRRAAAFAYERVLHFCKKRNIPFVELQLRLAGWKTDTFAALPSWAETMTKPVSTVKIQQEMQKVMHQGMGFAFWVALSAHQTANSLTIEDIREYAETLLRASNMKDTSWAQWPFKSVGMWTGNTLQSAAARFAGMQQNTRMPLSNTIGDVTGVVVDALHLDSSVKDRLIILKTHQRYFKDGNEAWRVGHVDSPMSQSLGGHFALVCANEEETLGKAWKRIQFARSASAVSTSGYHLIDSNMIQQWKGFCAVMVPLLQSVQAKIHRFRQTPNSSKLIKQTLHNLKHGEMARICSGHDNPVIPRIIVRSSSTSSSQLKSVSVSRSSSKTPSTASSRRASSASKKSDFSCSSSASLSGRSSQGYERKRKSASSSARSQSPIDQEAADVTAYLNSL